MSNLSKNRKAPTCHIMHICRNANMGTPRWWSVPVWLFVLKCITAFELISYCIKDPGLLENVALGLLIVILKNLYVFLHYLHHQALTSMTTLHMTPLFSSFCFYFNQNCSKHCCFLTLQYIYCVRLYFLLYT